MTSGPGQKLKRSAEDIEFMQDLPHFDKLTTIFHGVHTYDYRNEVKMFEIEARYTLRHCFHSLYEAYCQTSDLLQRRTCSYCRHLFYYCAI